MTEYWNCRYTILDQGLPRSAAGLLREAGLDAIHVGEIGYYNAMDASILQKGREDHRIIVTLDADFHDLLALSGAASPSVFRIRMEGLREKQAARLIQFVILNCKDELLSGAMVTVQPGRIHIRQLPLLR